VTPGREDPAEAVSGTFVFSYGSNLDAVRMIERVASARFVGLASLPLHDLRFHKRSCQDGTGKANAFLTQRAGDRVHGVIYEIDAEHLADLDRFEDRGIGYERHLMSFSTSLRGESVTVEAWVYIAEPDAIDDTLQPTRWYLDHVRRGARAHGLPQELIDELESLPTRDATESGRRSPGC